MDSTFDPSSHIYTPRRATRPLGSVNLRVQYPTTLDPIYDQGETNTCTANAVAAAIRYEQRRMECASEEPQIFDPSRLFIYWLARGGYKDEDHLFGFPHDGGSSVHEAMKGVAFRGVCPEKAWPFDPDKINEVPDQRTFDLAALSEVRSVYRIDVDRPRSNRYLLSAEQKDQQGMAVLENLRKCLTEEHPVVFEFQYRLPPSESFDSDRRPWVLKDVWSQPHSAFPRHAFPDDLPEALKIRNFCGEAISPAHIVLAVGYDDARQIVLVQNSRGASWGGDGTFWMPYSWITDYAATWDFWTIQPDCCLSR